MDDLFERREHRLLGANKGNSSVSQNQLSGVNSGQRDSLDWLSMKGPYAVANASVANRDANSLAPPNKGRVRLVPGQMGS